MPTLPQQFQNYLEKDRKLSASSIKNYVSDTNLFLNWLKLSLQEDQIIPQQVTSATILSYRDYLTNSRQTLAAKNRHLSSLRRFGYFLSDSGLTEINPAAHLVNVDPAAAGTSTHQLLHAFAADLKRQNLSPSTVKNYLSDLKQYLNWVLAESK